jgi:proton-dependent oligopeptide transporter, POT family
MTTSTPQGKMPKGIPYIVGNEAAERFSYYGMKAILAVFMTQYLFMSEGTSITWIHLFGMAVYFLPFFGALLSDMFLGKYKTIITLSIVYCLGHLVLALFENQEGLAWGLVLIAIGSGGIKPTVGSHVGDQFTTRNGHLIEKAFGYFYLAINVGAFVSALLTPWLLEVYGPHIAFGVPGLLMLLATWVFWLGRDKYITVEPVGANKYFDEVFTKETGLILFRLSLIYFVFIAVFWSLYDQTMSTWVLQASRSLMDKTLDIGPWHFDVLPSQIQAINAFFILTLTPLFAFVVYPILNKVFKLSPLRKIGIGLFVTAMSFVVSGWIDAQMEAGHTVYMGWQILAYFIITAGEVMVSITALEFAYTQAPLAIKSLIMAMYYIAITLGNGVTIIVNHAILTPIEVESISAAETGTYITILDDKTIEEGHRIDLPKVKTLYQTSTNDDGEIDTTYFSGTFIAGKHDLNSNQLEILDIDGKPVFYQTLPNHPTKVKEVTMDYNRYMGSEYYYFFVALMLGAAVLFIPVAYFYKGKYYVNADRVE